MPRDVTVTLSHDLGLDEARRRIRDGSGDLQRQLAGAFVFSFTEAWEHDDRLAFTAKGLGQTITGQIDIFPQHVRITATLPGLLASLAETIAGRVETKGRLLLEKKP